MGLTSCRYLTFVFRHGGWLRHESDTACSLGQIYEVRSQWIYILLTIFKNKMTREIGNVSGFEGGGEVWCTVTVIMQNLGETPPPISSSTCKEHSNSSCVVSVKSVFSFPDRPFYWLLCGWRRCLNCSPTTETAHWCYLDQTDPASTISSRCIGNILPSAQFSNLRSQTKGQFLAFYSGCLEFKPRSEDWLSRLRCSCGSNKIITQTMIQNRFK